MSPAPELEPRGDGRRSHLPERTGDVNDAIELKLALSKVLPPPASQTEVLPPPASRTLAGSFSFFPAKAAAEPTRLFSQLPPQAQLPKQAAAGTLPGQAAAAIPPVAMSSTCRTDEVAALEQHATKHALLSRRVELLQERLEKLDEKLGQLDQGLGFLSSMDDVSA